ncbi:winged helix-turn-helix transcriptional regulator [Catenovulum sp. SM1970]|uniref:ArsR/SmtB family transcription factor n=1 Tax=Marinifaba aquimaris TaxID=2741323 RepID=UPI001573EFD9|nr:metalloregulator ArsR/SmtB family transcription factor [Marinifaba aquimaris]NTS76490.1 winged helix-turn-helix transcriptional regulator [Marinifaba aquimaris]
MDKTSDLEKLVQSAEQATSMLKAMSNQSRLMILCRLLDNEMSVSALNKDIPLSQSALSQHLAALRKAELVKTRRQAQTIYYRLADDKPQKIIAVLKQCFCPDI